jgi:hypothetical protein
MKKLFVPIDLMWMFIFGVVTALLAIYPEKLFWRLFLPLLIIVLVILSIRTIIVLNQLDEEDEDKENTDKNWWPNLPKGFTIHFVSNKLIPKGESYLHVHPDDMPDPAEHAESLKRKYPYTEHESHRNLNPRQDHMDNS